jgi:hypothetical protein
MLLSLSLTAMLVCPCLPLPASLQNYVVFGHDAVAGLQIKYHTFGLDSGCVYGGNLSATRWPPTSFTRPYIASVPCVPGCTP